MENKNIDSIENKLGTMVSLIRMLTEKHPERVNDLNYIHGVCRQYAIDLDIMKKSLSEGQGHTSEDFFKEFIVYINTGLNDMRKLIAKAFNI